MTWRGAALVAVLVAAAGFVVAPGSARTARAAVGLFSLATSDLTGPTSVSAGQGIWRSAAIRNTSGDLRLTIGLAGAGERADWVQPAVAQVELAPGQQQIVRFSVIPPGDASGSFDVALRASLIEARREAIIGETPVVTAEAREIVFSIDVTPSSAAVGESGTPPTDDATSPSSSEDRARDANESLTGAPTIDAWRIVTGLLALAVLLGLVRRATRRRAARRISGSLPRTVPALAAARRQRPDLLAELASEQRALEAMRNRDDPAAEHYTVEQYEVDRRKVDRYEYDFGQARLRAEAKLRRSDDARHAAAARIEAIRSAERALHRVADERGREWVRTSTDVARERLDRSDPALDATGDGSRARDVAERVTIPVEAAADADHRRVPRPRRPLAETAGAPERSDDALDVARLNQALESARARDGFDERPANLSSR